MSTSLDRKTHYLRNPDYHGNLAPGQTLEMEFIATYLTEEQPVWDAELSQQDVCGEPPVTEEPPATTATLEPTTKARTTAQKPTTKAPTKPITTTKAPATTQKPTTKAPITDESVTQILTTLAEDDQDVTTQDAATQPSTTHGGEPKPECKYLSRS